MLITSIQIEKLENPSARMRARVSIVFDYAIMVQGIKILENEEKMFLGMPHHKRKDGTYEDIAHPLKKELTQMLERVVLDAYAEMEASGDMEAWLMLKDENAAKDLNELEYGYYRWKGDSEYKVLELAG